MAGKKKSSLGKSVIAISKVIPNLSYVCCWKDQMSKYTDVLENQNSPYRKGKYKFELREDKKEFVVLNLNSKSIKS